MRVVLDKGAILPTRAHPSDAGLDLYAMEAAKIEAGGSAIFNTGFHVEIPHGCAGIISPKSGLNVNHGIITDGIIDSGYTGSLRVKLYNLSNEPLEIERGNKIAQLLIVRVVLPYLEIVDELGHTERGNRGFGSTGK